MWQKILIEMAIMFLRKRIREKKIKKAIYEAKDEKDLDKIIDLIEKSL